MSQTMEEYVLVDDGYISEESDFYGSPATQSQLNRLARSYAPSPSPSLSSDSDLPTAHLPPTLRALAGLRALALTTTAASNLYTPGASLPNYRQLHESASTFVERLAPTSRLASQYDWLWAYNPHLGRDHAAFSGDGAGKRDLAGFLAKGRAVLRDLESKRTKFEVENPEMAMGVVTRKMAKERKEAEAGVREVAREKGVRCGKWLVFADEERVNKLWLKVVEATVEGELGFGAKVGGSGSTKEKDGDGDDDGEEVGGELVAVSAGGPVRRRKGTWVICVYTQDCEDVADVERVLQAMRSKGIVGARETLAYKSDAMTHLGVYANNMWKLPPSMYAAKDFKPITKKKATVVKISTAATATTDESGKGA